MKGLKHHLSASLVSHTQGYHCARGIGEISTKHGIAGKCNVTGNVASRPLGRSAIPDLLESNPALSRRQAETSLVRLGGQIVTESQTVQVRARRDQPLMIIPPRLLQADDLNDRVASAPFTEIPHQVVGIETQNWERITDHGARSIFRYCVPYVGEMGARKRVD